MMQNHVSLQTLNTLSIPAFAEQFIRVQQLSELKEALDFAILNSLPVLPLGGGSNIVFTGDYPGLVIQNQLTICELISENADSVVIEAESGAAWHTLVKLCVSQGWYGIENLALIPGTIGAAPIQNIGAYGVELADVFESLDYVNLDQHQPDQPQLHIQTLKKAACNFGYRDSVFKHELCNRAFITCVRLRLSKSPTMCVTYPALSAWLIKQKLTPTPENVFTAVCAIRSEKLPDPEHIPNAGSFFKNPVIDLSQYENLKLAYPDIVAYPAGASKIKLAAGWLIEETGWKGRSEQGVGMHEHQALVLVNPEKKTGEIVLATAREVAKDVLDKFNVRLEIEPRIY